MPAALTRVAAGGTAGERTTSVLRPALQLWNDTDKPLRVSLLPMGLLPEAGF